MPFFWLIASVAAVVHGLLLVIGADSTADTDRGLLWIGVGAGLQAYSRWQAKDRGWEE